MIYRFVGLQQRSQVVRQHLLILDSQKYPIVAPQQFKLRNAQKTERRPARAVERPAQRPQVRHMNHRVEEGHLPEASVDQPLLCRQHRRIGDNKREYQIA